MIHFLFPDCRPCSYSLRVLGFNMNQSTPLFPPVELFYNLLTIH